MLFRLADKYTYSVILTEFRRAWSKNEFVRLCKGKKIDHLGPRDPNSCPKVDFFLNSPEQNFRVLALVILRSFAKKLTGNVFNMVLDLTQSDVMDIRDQAKLVLKDCSDVYI